MGFLDKLFGGGTGPAEAPKPVVAPLSTESRRLCPSCQRKLLPGATQCPFCHPQHFGEELPQGTLSQDYKPQKGVASMGGIVVATALAKEHGARGFLHVYQGSNKGASVLLGTKPVSIGRSPEKNVLALNDGGVSTCHCEIRPIQTGFRLVDTGSKNGTFVNDQRVKDRDLANGDLLAFGATRVYVGIL